MTQTVPTPTTRTIDGAAVPAAGVYDLDPAHTHVGFAVRHLMVSKVRGRFARFTGAVTVGEDPLDSSVEVAVELASIDTRDDKRDAHLRSADFFDTEHNPTMTFRSTRVRRGTGSSWIVDGDLALNGVVRPVELQVTYEGAATTPWGTTSIGFSATGKLDREDFGLTWNQSLEAGGVLVGKDVTLEIEAEAIAR